MDGDGLCIKRLIAAVVRCNVEELHIATAAPEEPLELPRCLFVSASLTRLDLSICCTLKFPPSICLSSLKLLRFEYITFADEVSTMQFFSGCPALETMCFHSCNWNNLRSVGLCAPKLWKLEITEAMNYWSDFDSCEIMIIAPSLRYFYYNGKFFNSYCIFDSPPLNETGIHLREVGIGWSRIYFYRFFKLLNGISNVKQLLLSSDTGHEGVEISSDCENHELIFNPVPPCFLSHLKRIEIYQHYEDKELHRVMETVEILLSRAVVLDKLMISYSECMEKKEKSKKVHRKFLSLPRASEVLEINFTP